MNIEFTFEAEKNLTLIARKAVLQERAALGPIRKLVCPHCQSDRVRRRMQALNGCEYTCQNCRQNISEEDLPRCCPYPGKYIKCQDCAHFQAFTAAVKQKVQELRHLTPAERSAIVADPDFYKVEELQQGLSQGQSHTTANSPSSSIHGTTDCFQLSFFEDD